MYMPKFFVEPSQIKEDYVLIEGQNLNHIKNVLRLEIQDSITINDRQGNDYKCIIDAITHEHIHASILSKHLSDTEPAVDVTLFQPLIKGEKMEWVIQKAVELGVHRIITLDTERCVVKLEGAKKIQSKVERWNKIAESAAKQSGRGAIPEVVAPMSFKQAVDSVQATHTPAIIPYEKARGTSLRQVLQQEAHKCFALFIGPEGGFTEGEIDYAVAHGVQAVTLGRRILRSETASIATLTNIMYEMGEME